MPPIIINGQEVVKRYVGIQEVVAAYVGSQQVFASGIQFSAIQSLFASGEQGFLPNPNDFSTMFQDSAGTIPVTAANQPIGKIIDQSGRGNHVTQSVAGKRPYLRGTPTGANLVSDPFFYSGANWTAGSGWTIACPAADAVTASGALSLSGLAAEVGKTYLVTYSVQARSAGSVSVSFGGAATREVSGAGFVFEYITAVSTSGLAINGTGFTGKIRGITVRDASAGSVSAPYLYDFDGTDDFMSCAAMISAYPVSMFGVVTNLANASIPGLFSLHQGDTDNKMLDVSGTSRDWKESVVSFYGGGTFYTKQGGLAEFSSGSAQLTTDMIAGAAVAHSNTFGAKTNLFFGKGRSGDFFLRGPVYGGFVINRLLTSGEKASLYSYFGMTKNLQCWGDSMTAGSGAGVSIGYVPRLSHLVSRQAENQGAGGQTSTQIKDRFVADTSVKDQWTNIFWMGTNDSYIGDQPAWINLILANIATCVSGLKGEKRHLVLGVTRSEGSGVSKELLAALDAALLATYGNKFVDIRAYLQSKHDGSANDLADIADGLVPRSLRSDTIHLNDKGYQHTADLLASVLTSKGWV